MKAFLICICLVCASCTNQEPVSEVNPDPTMTPLPRGAIKGSLFIVTEGRGTIKLSNSVIYLIPYSSYKQYRKETFEKHQLLYNDASLRFTAHKRKDALTSKFEMYLNERFNNLSKTEKTNLFLYLFNMDFGNVNPIQAFMAIIDEGVFKENALYKSSIEYNILAYLTDKELLQNGNDIYVNLREINGAIQIRTDGDGEFNLESIEYGKYMVHAMESRNIGGSSEEYRWLIETDINSRTTNLQLSNHNFFVDNFYSIYPSLDANSEINKYEKVMLSSGISFIESFIQLLNDDDYIKLNLFRSKDEITGNTNPKNYRFYTKEIYGSQILIHSFEENSKFIEFVELSDIFPHIDQFFKDALSQYNYLVFYSE